MALPNKQVEDKNYFNYGKHPLMGAEVFSLPQQATSLEAFQAHWPV